MTSKTHFTVKEIEVFKKRIFREQQNELHQCRLEWYKRGQIEGEQAAINKIRRVLLLDDVPHE